MTSSYKFKIIAKTLRKIVLFFKNFVYKKEMKNRKE